MSVCGFTGPMIFLSPICQYARAGNSWTTTGQSLACCYCSSFSTSANLSLIMSTVHNVLSFFSFFCLLAHPALFLLSAYLFKVGNTVCLPVQNIIIGSLLALLLFVNDNLLVMQGEFPQPQYLRTG